MKSKEWCPQHGYPLPCDKCGMPLPPQIVDTTKGRQMKEKIAILRHEKEWVSSIVGSYGAFGNPKKETECVDELHELIQDLKGELKEEIEKSLLTETEIGDLLDLDTEHTFPCSDGSYTSTVDCRPIPQAQVNNILKILT